MAKTQRWQTIPTQLTLTEFEQFVLPHLVRGRRGPAPKLSLYKIFNYVLKMLYLGCQWKELPIDKDDRGKPEIHYTRIYRSWRRWVDMGCMDAIFAASVAELHEDGHLDTTVIHGDGTTTAAKKGATTSASTGTRRSRATRSSRSATAIAM
jgi:transposase